MTTRSCQFVVLAAGEGTRMRSKFPKVMHRIAGRPMLGHVLAAVHGADGTGGCAVVIGPDMASVGDYVAAVDSSATVHIQPERLGTAHAVLAARDAIPADQDVVVLYGDTPMVRPETIDRLRKAIADGADVAVLGFEAGDPTGYGRLLVESGRLTAIREERDATSEEKKITLCNSGVIAIRKGLATDLLDAIGNDNAKGEYYLTDAIGIADSRGLSAVAVHCDEEEVQGVNTRSQLAVAELAMQERLRSAAMDGGATLIDPASVYLSFDTRIGSDVVIEPNVVFGTGVTVSDDVTIRAFCHLEGTTVGARATIGPYARLRPGADIGMAARIGNFVEIKAAKVEEGAKVNHLTYIGDARVGAGANIGAGTITCNYDGVNKYHTDIGAGAFVGSNSALVAPVTIGDGAYVGSGSVITRDVPADSLAVGRARQVDVPGWKRPEKPAKSAK